MNLQSSKLFLENRLLSFDFFRGNTMFFFVANVTFLWSVLIEFSGSKAIYESNSVGGQWLKTSVSIFTTGFKTQVLLINLITVLSVLTCVWLIYYFLPAKQIFFRVQNVLNIN